MKFKRLSVFIFLVHTFLIAGSSGRSFDVNEGFLPGTIVKTLYGPQKIETLTSESIVLGCDLDGGYSYKKVIKVFRARVPYSIQIVVDNGDEIIFAAPEQKFYLPVESVWVKAQDLDCSMVFAKNLGELCSVDGIQRINQATDVYCLTVEGHYFCVGTLGIVVHNFVPALAAPVVAEGAWYSLAALGAAALKWRLEQKYLDEPIHYGDQNKFQIQANNSFVSDQQIRVELQQCSPRFRDAIISANSGQVFICSILTNDLRVRIAFQQCAYQSLDAIIGTNSDQVLTRAFAIRELVFGQLLPKINSSDGLILFEPYDGQLTDAVYQALKGCCYRDGEIALNPFKNVMQKGVRNFLDTAKEFLPQAGIYYKEVLERDKVSGDHWRCLYPNHQEFLSRIKSHANNQPIFEALALIDHGDFGALEFLAQRSNNQIVRDIAYEYQKACQKSPQFNSSKQAPVKAPVAIVNNNSPVIKPSPAGLHAESEGIFGSESYDSEGWLSSIFSLFNDDQPQENQFQPPVPPGNFNEHNNNDNNNRKKAIAGGALANELKKKKNEAQCLEHARATRKGVHRHSVEGLNNPDACAKLAAEHNYTCSTPASMGKPAPVEFNPGHIVEPEILIHCDKKVYNVGGFHHDHLGKIEQSGLVKFTNIEQGANGIYKAGWSYAGVEPKESTFFPKEWSPTKVFEKIKEALGNLVENPVFEKKRWCVNGKTNEGMKIKMVFETDPATGSPTGKIVSAYPTI